ncbi:MAG: DUF190 domain-containing protein [Candidatus Aenigmatarchaeota archaeon]
MKLKEEGYLLRMFIGEDDTYQNEPLYDVLVRKARDMGLAGATVLKGIEGYGANSRIHTANVLRLSEDLPVIIEIVDSKEYIDEFLEETEEMIEEGLVTLEKADVIKYTANQTEN